MKLMRRFLGLLVMLAGVLGLVLSLAGLVMVWVAKPTVDAFVSTTIDTLNDSVTTSQSVMEITGKALGGTIDSVDALSAMLGTTAATVEDTKPLLDQLNSILATTLPSTLDTATESLYTAQEATRVLEGTIQSLDSFRFLLSSAPLIGDLVAQSGGESYMPEKPLSESLGELAAGLEDLPDTFVGMSASLRSADGNLVSVQENLITMSSSVGLISSSLSEYEKMITQSRSSMDSLQSILANVRDNKATILTGAAIALTLFFAWLLAAQIVILSQGWELYQGTADRMAGDAQ